MAHSISPLSSNMSDIYERVPFSDTNVSVGSGFQPEGKIRRKPLSKQPTMLWKRAQRAWHHSWGAESYGILLAVSSLAAIVTVTAVFDGKATPEWPMKITINALIAVFTVLLKAGLGILFAEVNSSGNGSKKNHAKKESRCLMDLDDFDSASRGAVGSISFLLKIQPWEFTNTFAKFAAILTILAAIVDPFSQQIVGVVNCTKLSDQLRASIARANEYDANGGHTGALSSELDSPMAVAINVGLINPPNHIPSLISTICKSGNCSFDSFSSIAVCHSCTDISSQAKNNTDATGFYNYSLLADSQSGFSTLELSTSALLNTSASWDYGLLNLRVFSRKSVFSNAGPSAFQCQLFPCVRTYANVLIESSVLEETIVSKTAMGFDASGGLGRYVFVPSNYTYAETGHDKNGNQIKMDCNSPHASNDTTGLVFVPTANVDGGPSTPLSTNTDAEGAWYPSQCRFVFEMSPYLAIRPALLNYLDGTSLQYMTAPIGGIVAKNLWRNGTTSFDTVDVFMRNLSDVMTAQMRNNGANGAADFATGNVVVGETCVEIRWAWLSFPAALVGLGFVFIFVLIMQSPRDWPAVRSWKSSNLAVLFCNLDESIRQKTDLDWYRDEIDEVAQSSRVWLVRDGAGKARFVGDNDVRNI